MRISDWSSDVCSSDLAKIEQLVSTGYLKDIPVGGPSTPGFTNNWYIDETRGAALTFIGTDEGARNICQAARKRLGFTDATKSRTEERRVGKEGVRQCRLGGAPVP